MRNQTPTPAARLASLSAAALLAVSPALAQQGGSGDPDAVWIDVTTWDAAAVYDGWSADRALDEPVLGASGEELGELEDIIIGGDGRIRDVIVEGGGVLDIGDTHAAVPWERVDRAGPERMELTLAAESLDAGGRFPNMDDVPTKPESFRVRELIGDTVTADGVGYGRVDDVLFSETGEVLAVVVFPAPGRGYRTDPVAVPYNARAYDPYGPYYAVPYTAVELDALAPYEARGGEG
jgi:sporulation protein YlmC with PRC-barrel domain